MSGRQRRRWHGGAGADGAAALQQRRAVPAAAGRSCCAPVALMLLVAAVAAPRAAHGVESCMASPHCALLRTDGTVATAPPLFLEALTNRSVNEIVLAMPRYVLRPAAWAVYSQAHPYRLQHNVTVRGSAQTLSVMDFSLLEKKVLLAPGVTVALRHLVLQNARKLGGFGLDFFVGESGSSLVLDSVMRVKAVCQLPQSALRSARTFSRASPTFPPNEVELMPKLCITAALEGPEPSRYCFNDALHFQHFSLLAAYNDPDKGSQWPGYVLYQYNTTRVCQRSITQQCLDENAGDEEVCMAMLIASPGARGGGTGGGAGSTQHAWSLGAVAGVAVAGAVAVLAAVAVVALRRRLGRALRLHRKLDPGAGPDMEQGCSRHLVPSDGQNSGPHAATPTSYTRAISQQVTLGVLLGAGSFGRVYRGRWHSMDVAIKIITVRSPQELPKVLREAEVMMQLNHDNIVRAFHASVWNPAEQARALQAREARSSFSSNSGPNARPAPNKQQRQQQQQQQQLQPQPGPVPGLCSSQPAAGAAGSGSSTSPNSTLPTPSVHDAQPAHATGDSTGADNNTASACSSGAAGRGAAAPGVQEASAGAVQLVPWGGAARPVSPQLPPAVAGTGAVAVAAGEVLVPLLPGCPVGAGMGSGGAGPQQQAYQPPAPPPGPSDLPSPLGSALQLSGGAASSSSAALARGAAGSSSSVAPGSRAGMETGSSMCSSSKAMLNAHDPQQQQQMQTQQQQTQTQQQQLPLLPPPPPSPPAPQQQQPQQQQLPQLPQQQGESAGGSGGLRKHLLGWRSRSSSSSGKGGSRGSRGSRGSAIVSGDGPTPNAAAVPLDRPDSSSAGGGGAQDAPAPTRSSRGSRGSASLQPPQPALQEAEQADDDETHQHAEVQVWIILELCTGGTLMDAVTSGQLTTNHKLDMAKLLSRLLDAANGMAYLHSKGVMHGDLKAGNVLLQHSIHGSYGQVAKISDFGLSAVLLNGATHRSTASLGTLTHMPPELLRSGRMSPSADVYSFGILMWEVYCGRQAWQGLHYGVVVERVVIQKERPPVPPDMPDEFTLLMRSCWDADPAKRPTFPQIVQCLELMLDNLSSNEDNASASLASASSQPPPLRLQPGSGGSHAGPASLDGSVRGARASSHASGDGPAAAQAHAQLPQQQVVVARVPLAHAADAGASGVQGIPPTPQAAAHLRGSAQFDSSCVSQSHSLSGGGNGGAPGSTGGSATPLGSSHHLAAPAPGGSATLSGVAPGSGAVRSNSQSVSGLDDNQYLQDL